MRNVLAVTKGVLIEANDDWQVPDRRYLGGFNWPGMSTTEAARLVELETEHAQRSPHNPAPATVEASVPSLH